MFWPEVTRTGVVVISSRLGSRVALQIFPSSAAGMEKNTWLPCQFPGMAVFVGGNTPVFRNKAPAPVSRTCLPSSVVTHQPSESGLPPAAGPPRNSSLLLSGDHVAYVQAAKSGRTGCGWPPLAGTIKHL